MLNKSSGAALLLAFKGWSDLYFQQWFLQFLAIPRVQC